MRKRVIWDGSEYYNYKSVPFSVETYWDRIRYAYLILTGWEPFKAKKDSDLLGFFNIELVKHE